MTELEIIDDFMKGQREEIIRLQSSKGIRASGESAEKLRVETEQNGSVITSRLIDGAGYFRFQEQGRGSGKFPPLDAIYEWLAYRKYGFNYSNDRERRSLAFLIGRSQAQKGSYTHRTGGKSGVITESGFQEGVSALTQKLVGFHRAHITETLNVAIKT